jgi:peptidoglycan L-alanyl-D-glutamate endopeptidase CwlK
MDKKTKYWLIGLGFGVATLGVLTYLYRKEIRNTVTTTLKETFGGYKWFDDSLAWYRNQDTKSIVNALHPKAVDRFKEFISRVEKELGLQIIATSGYRTWERQAELKKENPSNASAGNSAHNYGFALDVNVLDKSGNSLLKKATSKQKWIDSGVVRIAKDMGFSWGGDFKNYHDPVHFYYDPLPISELKKKYLAGQRDAKGYVTV